MGKESSKVKVLVRRSSMVKVLVTHLVRRLVKPLVKVLVRRLVKVLVLESMQLQHQRLDMYEKGAFQS